MWCRHVCRIVCRQTCALPGGCMHYSCMHAFHAYIECMFTGARDLEQLGLSAVFGDCIKTGVFAKPSQPIRDTEPTACCANNVSGPTKMSVVSKTEMFWQAQTKMVWHAQITKMFRQAQITKMFWQAQITKMFWQAQTADTHTIHNHASVAFHSRLVC